MESPTKAEQSRIEAAARAENEHVEARARREAALLTAQADAEAMRVRADVDALRRRAEVAGAYAAHPALLRLRELETLTALEANAGARLYIDFDKGTSPD